MSTASPSTPSSSGLPADFNRVLAAAARVQTRLPPAVVVGGTAMTGGAGGVLNTLIGSLIMGILNNGMTVIGIDVYAQQVFLGILVIIAVAVTFDRKKLAIIK